MSPHFFQEWGKSFFQVSLYIRENKTLDLRPEPEVVWLGLRIEAVKGLQLGLVGPEVLKGVAVLPGRFLDVGVLWDRLQPMVGLKLVLRLALMMPGLKVGQMAVLRPGHSPVVVRPLLLGRWESGHSSAQLVVGLRRCPVRAVCRGQVRSTEVGVQPPRKIYLF